MKKFMLGLFVLASLTLTTACSSDDDSNGGGASGDLVVTIDGQTLTFDSIIVDEYSSTDDGVVYNEIDVTATIGGDSTKVIEFGLETGDTGANAVYYFYYTVDGQEFYSNGSFSTVVSVNNGSSLAMTFSGTLSGYNEETQQNETIMIENGSVSVNY